ncbi:MAG: cyclic pyranopterin monophosphate synthase MoaC [Anaerolineales bacterium]|nr:MAG: cyclic pyranopterin monophosphate synthase MoaC [Anaerolineales bacterium]
MTDKKLSHLDPSGQARMVDVSAKQPTERRALARARVRMSQPAFDIARKGDLKKGDLRATAELAGVMAAKKTADLIPLCHPLMLNNVQVQVEWDQQLPGVTIQAEVQTTGRTGVEMEAMTAVAVTALTVYDMIKAVDRSAVIESIRLVEKHGGSSGDVVLE